MAENAQDLRPEDEAAEFEEFDAAEAAPDEEAFGEEVFFAGDGRPHGGPIELDADFQQSAFFKRELPLRKTMLAWMRAACERDAFFAVRFVRADEGRALNLQFRERDYATNILTFDYMREPVVRADIAVCVPVLMREAAEQGKSFREHLAHILIHGVLHAHGYDHVSEEEAEAMEARETEIMLSLGFRKPYSDRIGMVHD